jgi:GMP reductase
MRILDDVKLDFNDVLIRPKRSKLSSRSEVDLARKTRVFDGVPVIAANMDTTGTFEIADALATHGMMTAIHKHYDVEQLYDFFFTKRQHSFYSMGITPTDLHKWNVLKSKLPKGNIKYVCIDVANGYTERFIDFCSAFKSDNPEITLMAGNVVTGDVTEQLILAGVDIVKVGIGPGSVCTTRLKTGVGYPQLSAVMECADAAHGLGGFVCADGGCVSPGDIAKAFGAGADFVMLGSMFAGHEESGGETTIQDGKMFKTFYGMSSENAMEKYSGGVAEYRAAEGKTVSVPFKGSVHETALDILGGLRSACTYVGAKTLKELPKCTTFIRVNNTHNKIFE